MRLNHKDNFISLWIRRMEVPSSFSIVVGSVVVAGIEV